MLGTVMPGATLRFWSHWRREMWRSTQESCYYLHYYCSMSKLFSSAVLSIHEQSMLSSKKLWHKWHCPLISILAPNLIPCWMVVEFPHPFGSNHSVLIILKICIPWYRRILFSQSKFPQDTIPSVKILQTGNFYHHLNTSISLAKIQPRDQGKTFSLLRKE